MGSPTALFKLVVVGADGPVKRGVLRELAYDMFEGDYLATIGTEIHMCEREIDGELIKVVIWQIPDDLEFQQLHRAYYQNSSMVILTAESTTPDALQHYRELVHEINKVQGKIPITIVTALRPNIDENAIRTLADELDASQIVLDFDDTEDLKKLVDRMIREVRFLSRDKIPYPIALLRNHGLALESLNIDTAIHVIRNSDSPYKNSKIFEIKKIDDYLKNSGSSIFFDIDQLARTQLARFVPEILKERMQELQRVWAIRRGPGYDLRYVWLTAYGFEILRSLGFGLVVDSVQFEIVKDSFSAIGFDLQVRGKNNLPEVPIDDDLRQFVWNLVEKMTS